MTLLESWKSDNVDPVDVVVVLEDETAGAGVQRVRTMDCSSFSIAGVWRSRKGETCEV